MEYKTRDSQSAMVLLSQGERFSTKYQDGIVWFIFEDSDACEAILDAHINRELLVPSIDLTNAQHEIKKIIIRNKNWLWKKTWKIAHTSIPVPKTSVHLILIFPYETERSMNDVDLWMRPEQQKWLDETLYQEDG